MFKKLLYNGARNGAVLTLTTTAAILVATANERDDAWGAINNISHIVDGDDVAYSDSFSPRESSIGFAINGTAMTVWAYMYEAMFGKIRFPKSIATSVIFTAGAYVVDYYLVPRRYTPGIEHKISKKAIFAIYCVMAFTLFLTSLTGGKKR